MLKFIYNDRSDFKKNDGVPISDDSVQEMIDSVTSIIVDNNEKYAYAATGDTIVIGFGFNESNFDDDRNDNVEIYVCKNYEHAEAWIENGRWEKIDWLMDYEYEEQVEELQSLSKDELIDIILRDGSYD